MKAPLFVRPLSIKERQILQGGRHSLDAFTQRRCQILLASAEGQTTTRIAAALGCAHQTVLNALNAFAADGLGCLIAKSHRPKNTRALIGGFSAEQIRSMLRRCPSEFGQARGRWTLAVLAKVAFEQGLTDREVSEETIRQVVKRLGMDWKEARLGAITPPHRAGFQSAGSNAHSDCKIHLTF
jgi:transposase